MDPNSPVIISNRFHETIILHFHQSNRLAERSIQTIKHGLEKAKLANEDHYLSISFLNSQPEENGLSLAYRLVNRRIHTILSSVKPRPKFSTTKAAILKSGDIIRIRTNKQNNWDKEYPK